MRALSVALLAVCFTAALAAPLAAVTASSSSSVAEVAGGAREVGEKLLADLKASGVCGTAGVDLSKLTQAAGATDYSYSDKDGHNTWYARARWGGCSCQSLILVAALCIRLCLMRCACASLC